MLPPDNGGFYRFDAVPVAVVGPNEQQRAVGQDWAACLVYLPLVTPVGDHDTAAWPPPTNPPGGSPLHYEAWATHAPPWADVANATTLAPQSVDD